MPLSLGCEEYLLEGSRVFTGVLKDSLPERIDCEWVQTPIQTKSNTIYVAALTCEHQRGDAAVCACFKIDPFELKQEVYCVVAACYARIVKCCST